MSQRESIVELAPWPPFSGLEVEQKRSMSGSVSGSSIPPIS